MDGLDHCSTSDHHVSPLITRDGGCLTLWWNSSLYVLGLYEYSSTYLWPSFYVIDRTDIFSYNELKSFLVSLTVDFDILIPVMRHFLIISFFALCSVISASGMVYLTIHPEALMDYQETNIALTETRTFVHILSYYSINVIVKGCLVVIFALGVGTLIALYPQLGLLVQLALFMIGRALRFGYRATFRFRTIVFMLPVSIRGFNLAGHLQEIAFRGTQFFPKRIDGKWTPIVILRCMWC